MEKILNPINQGPSLIGNDGKYSSIEELTRANIIHENRQYTESILPKELNIIDNSNEPKIIDIVLLYFQKN